MRNFGDIINECVTKARISTNQTKYIDMLKSGINKKYFELMNMRKWWFRRARRDLNVVAKQTLTCVFTNGSRAVTTPGLFTDAHKGLWIKATGYDYIYKISSVDSNGRAILSVEFHGESGSLSADLWKSDYPLWPDCDDIVSVWHDGRERPMEQIGPTEMFKMMASDPTYSDQAYFYTKAGLDAYQAPALGNFLLGDDFLSSSEKRDEVMIIYPASHTTSYPLHVEYLISPVKLVANEDEPRIPRQYLYMLVDGGLAEWYSDIKNWDKVNIHKGDWNLALSKLLVKNSNMIERPRMRVDMRAYVKNRFGNYPIAWGKEWDKM